MRTSFRLRQIIITKPKGSEEGSEIRIIWPSAHANYDSVVEVIDQKMIRLKPLSGSKAQTIRLSRQKGTITLIPQVQVGSVVKSNQIVASLVDIHTMLAPQQVVDESYFEEKVNSINLTERYAAAKALRYRGYTNSEQTLKDRILDNEENIYVQLEAAAALAVHNIEVGWEFLEDKTTTSPLTTPLETQLETIIVLSEIQDTRSEKNLISILHDDSRHEEIRSGAAWALGRFKSIQSVESLITSFRSNPLEIRVEAARALLSVGHAQMSHLVQSFTNGESQSRDGIAWVLAKLDGFDPATCINAQDENLRKWISYVVGYGRSHFTQQQLDRLYETDPEVFFAASVLWQLLDSWICNLEEI